MLGPSEFTLETLDKEAFKNKYFSALNKNIFFFNKNILKYNLSPVI